MQFSREINRLLIGVLIAFALVGASTTYWSIVGPDTILKRTDNPRLVEAEANILRGDIVDRDGQLLVTTVPVDGVVTREYLHPSMFSALGYYSLRYGVGGAEAAFDDILRGDDLEVVFFDDVARDLLHQPQQGSDIRLTLDLDIQRRATEAMMGQTGAVIVLDVPSGGVLAMVSLPTYDPNTLTDDWETLLEAPGNPFFNRALQGNYQPGGMLQTPLLVGALSRNQTLDASFEAANASVSFTVAGEAPVADTTIELNCLIAPTEATLTLGEAYIYGCPAPFVTIANILGTQNLQTAFDTFLLSNPPTLPGFVAEPEPAEVSLTPLASTPTPVVLTETNLVADAMGQGQLTITPLNMAMIVSAFINDGNAPQPFTLLEIRRPNTESWTPVSTLHPTTPLTTANTAHQMQSLMRESVESGTAQAAAHPGMDIGGQAAIAYSGQGSKAWFAGFVTLPGGRGIVVVVVLENSDSPNAAASLGGTILASAAAHMAQDS